MQFLVAVLAQGAGGVVPGHQRFGEDADCFVGATVRGECKKLHCVLRHYASGVSFIKYKHGHGSVILMR
jgi:hypothetical protein